MNINNETPAEFLSRLGDDAVKWAAEFKKTAIELGYSDMDEGWLVGWFANAIEHSCDVRRWHNGRKKCEESTLVQDETKIGLYPKWDAKRINDPTGKHSECDYYVLDLVHDKFAPAAINAYIIACESEFPFLATALRGKISLPTTEQPEPKINGGCYNPDTDPDEVN